MLTSRGKEEEKHCCVAGRFAVFGSCLLTTVHPPSLCHTLLSQYLFATYIAPSASLDIGLHQEGKKDIYMKIQPPFEDLFDTAEEFILLSLLEPWTQMVMSDQVAYKKVCWPANTAVGEGWPQMGPRDFDFGRHQAQQGKCLLALFFNLFFLASFPIVS